MKTALIIFWRLRFEVKTKMQPPVARQAAFFVC
jgi:hypothetical protein